MASGSGGANAGGSGADGGSRADTLGDIFNMDYSEGAADDAGWGSHFTPDPQRFGLRRRAGEGPRGRDAYELEQIANPGLEHYGGQFGWGWGGRVEATDPGGGVSRFYRLYVRFDRATDGAGLSWDVGETANSTNKLLITQNGTPGRFIPNWSIAQLPAVRFDVGLDGGLPPHQGIRETDFVYPVGEWHSLQYEHHYSTGNATDGYLKGWFDNDDYDTPDVHVYDLVVPASGDGNQMDVILGAYCNNGLQEGGTHTWQNARFQVATTFDDRWHAEMLE